MASIPEQARRKQAGASGDQINKFETATGYPLPQELQTVYSISNGAKGVFNELDLLPLADVIQHWNEWKPIFDSWSMEELFGNNQSDGEMTLGMYTNPRWIPLVEKYQSHYIGMDLMPGAAGKVGQIIHFGRDQDLIVRDAENLIEFLKSNS